MGYVRVEFRGQAPLEIQYLGALRMYVVQDHENLGRRNREEDEPWHKAGDECMNVNE